MILSIHRKSLLITRFAELSRADPHLGVSPGAPSGDDPSLTLEQERYH